MNALQVLSREGLLDRIINPANPDRYDGHLKPFLAFVAETDDPQVADFETVRDYFRRLRELAAIQAIKPATARVRRQAVKKRLKGAMTSMDLNRQAQLRAALAALDADGSGTEAPKLNKGANAVVASKVLSLAEVEALLTGTSRRTALFVRFLFNTACRVAEMCSARLEKCSSAGRMVAIEVWGKGGKSRPVQIERELFDAIAAEFQGRTFLFETSGRRPFDPNYVSGEIAKAGRRILNRKISAHCLRHSWATYRIRSGSLVKAVSEYMGHASTSITLDMYDHETLSEEEMVLLRTPAALVAVS